MPIRTRDLCQESLDFAIAERLLKSYSKSGRYVAPPKSRSPHSVDEEIMIIAHYSACEGPLYTDERLWKKAFLLTSGFTKKESNRLNRRWWTLTRVFGPLDGIVPIDVLAQLHAALLRFGFQAIDRNDVTFTAAFTSGESCRVMDLPEPYGKWYQARDGKPRWKQDIDLEIDLKCQVFSEDALSSQAESFASFVNFQISSLAAPLFIFLETELAALLQLDRLTGTEALKRNLVASMRRELERL